MLKIMSMRRLPPLAKALVYAMTAGLAILVAVTGTRVGLIVSKAKRGQIPSSASPAKAVTNTPLDALGAILLSAPSLAQQATEKRGAEVGKSAPPPLDISGLDLKGVFVNMFNRGKSIAIIGSKGKKDIILKCGDVTNATDGVMLEEIYPDHVVFRGLAGDRRSISLTNFIKEAVIFGRQAVMTESLADIEDPMGAPIYDPTSPGPGMAGDVSGNGGMETGPVKFMPIPKMPTVQKDGSRMAAPVGHGSETAISVSNEMNAAGQMGAEGQK